MNEHIFEISTENFQQQVIQAEIPVLLDFTAVWCPPCKMLDPIVDELATKYDGQMRVGKVDVDINPEIQEMFGVMGIPTLILFKGGQPVEYLVGFKPRNQIESALTPHLQHDPDSARQAAQPAS
jgi:thioredoxin 1